MQFLRMFLERLGLVLAGLVVALAGLEVSLRLVGVGGPAELPAIFDRGTAYFYPDPERQNPWARGEEEVFRVAVVGDSYTAGEGNYWDDTYPIRLERLLNLNSGVVPAEVRVFAQRGTSTRQQLKWLPQIIEFDPALVILGIYLNDTEEVYGAETATWRQEFEPRIPRGWKLALLRRSRACEWLWEKAESVRLARAGIRYHERIYDPRYSGWRKFEEALDILSGALRERDIRLVAVVFPFMGALGEDYPLRFAHRRLDEALAQRGINRLDLLGHFADKSPLRMSVLPKVDDHPNEIAHRIAAHAIFRFLLDEKLIDCSYAPSRKIRGQRRHDWLRKLRRGRGYLHTDSGANPALERNPRVEADPVSEPERAPEARAPDRAADRAEREPRRPATEP